MNPAPPSPPTHTHTHTLGQQKHCLMNIYGGIWEVLGNRPAGANLPKQLGIVWVLK